MKDIFWAFGWPYDLKIDLKMSLQVNKNDLINDFQISHAHFSKCALLKPRIWFIINIGLTVATILQIDWKRIHIDHAVKFLIGKCDMRDRKEIGYACLK